MHEALGSVPSTTKIKAKCSFKKKEKQIEVSQLEDAGFPGGQSFKVLSVMYQGVVSTDIWLQV